LIDVDHLIQSGIRTEYHKEGHGFEVVDAATANDLTAQHIVEQVRARVVDMPLYITFDIDCVDPANAPGNGTPVCGG
tara:strand:+ start:27428 stop:27658 length:231 start_codon:yes stop_codon:yes gene_type:complete